MAAMEKAMEAIRHGNLLDSHGGGGASAVVAAGGSTSTAAECASLQLQFLLQAMLV